MKKLGVLVVASAFCLLPSALAASTFGDPMHGQRLFVSKGCVYCHAVRGAGGRIGPDLGRSEVKGSFYELFAAMWNHSPAMEDKVKESRLTRPKFSGEELSDLLAFLYFLNYFDEPGDPRAGKTLFAQKHCIECHAVGKEGGASGPRLDALLARGTPPLQIAQNLWNHGPRMTAMMRSRNLQLPTFRGAEIIDLFAYLRTQGRTKSQRELRSAGDPEKGRALFSAKGCDRCHALFGKGGGLGPDLGTAELHGSVTQLAGRMWNHWPAMAGAMDAMGMSRPVFHGDEMADVFAFLFIARYDATAATAAQGEAVYVRGGCASCHGMHGEGGIGTALAKRTTGESKEQIAQRMWNHASKMHARMGDRRLPWPRLTAEDLAALIHHLRALQ